MSFIQKVPLRRLLRCASTPRCSGPGPRSPFGQLEPSSRSRSVLVVSHHLDGFLRAFAPSCLAAFVCVELRACCIPLSTMGFALFQASLPTFQSLVFRELPFRLPASALASRSTLAGRRPFPATLVTPSKAFPSPTATSRHPRSTLLASCLVRLASLGSPSRIRARPLCFRHHQQAVGATSSADSLFHFPHHRPVSSRFHVAVFLVPAGPSLRRRCLPVVSTRRLSRLGPAPVRVSDFHRSRHLGRDSEALLRR